MENAKIQVHIRNWLVENHASDTHIDILKNVLTVGKPSQRWVETIQRYIAGKAMQNPQKGEIKIACRAILQEME